MATEKYFCFDEQGELKRIKGRLVRFLDNEAPTGSDKSAIRTSLEVSPDAEGLVQADVGTDPNQLVLHQHLGDISYQSAEAVSMGTVSADEVGVGVSDPNAKLHVSDETAPTLRLSRTGTGQIWQQSIDSNGRLIWQEAASEGGTKYTRAVLDDDGNFGIGTASPDHPLTLKANPGAANTPVAWLHNSGNVSEYDGTVISTVNDGSDVEVLHVRTNTTTYDGGSSLLLVRGDGQVGIGGSPTYELDVQAGNSRIAATSSAGVVNHLQADNTGAYVGPLSNHNLYFKQNNTTRWTIDTSGNFVSSGGGIDFGSGASTTLDDYEVSDHTATGTPAGGAISFYSNNNTLRAVKVGSLVSVTGRLMVQTSSATGAYLDISLPHVVGDYTNVGGSTAAVTGFYDSSAATYNVVYGTASEGDSHFRVRLPSFGANDEYYVNLTYHTSA